MPTHYQGTESEIRALNAYIKLLRASESVASRLMAFMASDHANLTITQFGVLEALYHLGPLNQKDIGTKMLKSGGNITLVIDNLSKQGLVERKRSEEDRRVVYAHLTPSGRDFIGTYFPCHARAIEQEMNVLTPGEQEELGRLCRKLGLGSPSR